ncbi:uncharacterized protein KNAG_0C05980 [Huiozyma naganishii CBS 8797]|uniref:Zn(2)-C6 fungal-type domain-containing protein n=1 Tax=Huiozyma naganishii (strain ATCC MYA-139 / BCRC 22969 / CBS 8797 / KCTC 17520 / NBRC 10181 / NCYC 3082 / Yp74L-3) TaxID=1071383 RepID=J7S6D7_HUIN7|nr:hypothetical protein KNAG_0C05980 [Kazachstania naganishii CBS 8797]CCK69696.1 hypothetical protein KNAG_0C05980 [Kazachstania naganishii CBS 8797]
MDGSSSVRKWADGVQKPAHRRRKTVLACTNCRRRKIKCTGKWPCSNCEAYSCVCEYVDKAAQVKFAGGSGNSVGTVAVSSESPSLPTATAATTTTPTISTLVNEVELTSPPLAGPTTAVVSPSPNGLYEGDIEDDERYAALSEALAQLKAVRPKNSVIEALVQETQGKLDELADSWQPRVNLQSFRGDKSLETALMKNKYRDKLHLTRFASLTTSEMDFPGAKAAPRNGRGFDTCTPTNTTLMNNIFNQQQSFLSRLPLVDDIFGLYSPVETFSLRGLGLLVQRFALEPSSGSNGGSSCGDGMREKVKATVYILLRFFDICCLHLNEGVVSIADPLENYLRSREPGYRASPRWSSPHSSLNDRDLVLLLIGMFPQPLTEQLTGVTRQRFESLVSEGQDLEMFRTLLQMYDKHRVAFEQLITSMTLGDGETLSMRPLNDFCALQDLLLTLCYSYYNATLYHLDEYNSLEYLELLLQFLDHVKWLDQAYAYEKVLAVAVDCALKLGLSRWEYYVGLDETNAERRRVLWWRLYCHEKTYTFRCGALSVIDDRKVNCLLPRVFRSLRLVQFAPGGSHGSVDRSLLDSLTSEELRFYGECSMSHVLSGYYESVLYNERYTAIDNSAKPQHIRKRYLSEVSVSLGATSDQLQAIQRDTGRLLDRSSSGYDDMYAIICHYHVALLHRSTINLMSRLEVPQGTAALRGSIRQIYREWRVCTQVVLDCPTGYSMWRTFHYYTMLLLMVCPQTLTPESQLTMGDVVSVLRIFWRIVQMTRQYVDPMGLRETGFPANDAICRSETFKDFGRSFSIFSILIRLILLDKLQKNSWTEADLHAAVRQEQEQPPGAGPPGGACTADDLCKLVDMFLDHGSYLFSFILARQWPAARARRPPLGVPAAAPAAAPPAPPAPPAPTKPLPATRWRSGQPHWPAPAAPSAPAPAPAHAGPPAHAQAADFLAAENYSLGSLEDSSRTRT